MLYKPRIVPNVLRDLEPFVYSATPRLSKIIFAALVPSQSASRAFPFAMLGISPDTGKLPQPGHTLDGIIELLLFSTQDLQPSPPFSCLPLRRLRVLVFVQKSIVRCYIYIRRVSQRN